MKKWSILIIALLFFSCSDEVTTDPIPEPGGEAGTFTMTVRVPGVNLPTNYSDPITEVRENDIREIDILAFRETENDDEEFCYRVAVQKSDIQEVVSSVNGSEKTFKLELKREDYGVRLVVLANARSSLNAIQTSLVEGTPKQSILNALTFNGNAWKNVTESSFVNAFPMMGQTAELVYTTTQTTTSIQKASLLRAVAKVDIGVDIYGDPAIGFGKRFAIKNVFVYRANDKGRVSPHKDDLSKSQATKTNIPADATALPVITYAYEKDVTENAIVRKIYLAESDAYAEGQEGNATCLVIQAKYDGGADTYYRVDFMNHTSEYLPLLRNHRYLINITQIRGDGYSTADEAAASKSSSLIYDLTVSDDGINDIEYNGQHMIGVNKGVFYADWGTSTQSLTVFTNYSSGWTMTDADSWIVIDNENLNGIGNEKKTFSFTVNNNTTGFTRTGKITLSAGTLKKEVLVVQSGGSNCIVARPNSAIDIPLKMANADGISRIDAYTSTEMYIVWQDIPNPIGSVSVPSNSNLSAKVFTTNATGNAVIGVRNTTNGKTLWSWHIWVTNQDIESPTYQVQNNYMVFMDRNLGASSTTSYGLYYQWGRKDPFAGSVPAEKVSMVNSGVSNNLETAIQNPDIFYASSIRTFDWIGMTQNNNLWNTPNGEKSAYDPCPFGWRVPVANDDTSGSPWYGFTGSYPLAGGLDLSSGQQVGAGNQSYVWGASVRGFNGFVFDAGNRKSSSAFRANGYPVRCVKDVK
ncbi:MAG: BACON domain-containing protein [Parabacteroides sp.]|nr:BACON domain-containing protein [Parabacteroides sp.]